MKLLNKIKHGAQHPNPPQIHISPPPFHMPVVHVPPPPVQIPHIPVPQPLPMPQPPHIPRMPVVQIPAIPAIPNLPKIPPLPPVPKLSSLPGLPTIGASSHRVKDKSTDRGVTAPGQSMSGTEIIAIAAVSVGIGLILLI